MKAHIFYLLLLAVGVAAVPVLTRGEESWVDVKAWRRLAVNVGYMRREYWGWHGRRDVWRHMCEGKRGWT